MKPTYTKVSSVNFRGTAALYKLSEKVPYNQGRQVPYNQGRHRPRKTDYVIVSAISDMYTTETYIFPATRHGEVEDWAELQGSYEGGMCHETALNGLGFYKGESK